MWNLGKFPLLKAIFSSKVCAVLLNSLSTMNYWQLFQSIHFRFWNVAFRTTQITQNQLIDCPRLWWFGDAQQEMIWCCRLTLFWSTLLQVVLGECLKSCSTQELSRGGVQGGASPCEDLCRIAGDWKIISEGFTFDMDVPSFSWSGHPTSIPGWPKPAQLLGEETSAQSVSLAYFYWHQDL